MLFSIISILVGCSGGEQEVETPVAPVVPAVTPTEPVSTTDCTDPTPEDGVDDCAKKETVAPTTESTAAEPTIVVVAK